jgi:hypothetical protein
MLYVQGTTQLDSNYHEHPEVNLHKDQVAQGSMKAGRGATSPVRSQIPDHVMPLNPTEDAAIGSLRSGATISHVAFCSGVCKRSGAMHGEDIHLAAAVLSKRYEEQLFSQASQHSKGGHENRKYNATML